MRNLPHKSGAVLYPVCALGLALALLSPNAGTAQACAPASYEIREGDTVFSISERFYGDFEKWSLIFYSNPGALSNPQDLPAGVTLTIPCPPSGAGFVEGALEASAAPEPAPEPAVAVSAVAPEVATPQPNVELNMLTGGGNAPFADRDWPEQGMMTELVNAVMDQNPSPVTYAINWDDDRARHFFPMLDSATFDMGFPWAKPDCDGDPAQEKCARFHYSDPVIEVLDLIFVRGGQEFDLSDEAALQGKVICRPDGLFVHEFDRPDRLWLTREVISLTQPAGPQDCFASLMAGDVDAVAVNEFTGWSTVSEMGLRGQVVPLPDALGILGLHMVISKKHWRGTAHLYRFNAGLAALKASDTYDEIVSRHLGVFWDSLN